MKTMLLAGAALAASIFAASSAAAAPTDCKRVTMDLGPPISAINECGHQLAWWGARFVPGGANGGGSSWVEPVVVKQHYCPPPPPCWIYTVKIHRTTT